MAALKPLGYIHIKHVAHGDKSFAGFGTDTTAQSRNFWIQQQAEQRMGSRYCIAFQASTKEEVDIFYAAALATGGRDNGAPGYQPEFGQGCYAAFVYDPDGYNIEAVCHDTSGH